MTSRNPHLPILERRYPYCMIIGNAKGGTGKSTVAHHLALQADETGLTVLALDTDPQGDLYRRLQGGAADMESRPPARFGRRGWVTFSPGGYELPPLAELLALDLVLVDSPPAGVSLPHGSWMHELVVPVDGYDAARNGVELATEALAQGRVGGVTMVLNRADAGGPEHVKAICQIEAHLPAGASLYPRAIPLSQAVARAELYARPAWEDPHPDDEGVLALVAFCDSYLDRVRAWLKWASVENVLAARDGVEHG